MRAIMNVGNTTHANLAGIELAKQYPFIYCSIGIHPDRAAEIAAQNSREYLDVIARQLSYEKAMALGEIGLDYYYDDASPRDVQRKIFEEQLALAKDLDVPVIIHNRDAHRTHWNCSTNTVPRASCTAFPARQRSLRRCCGWECTSDSPVSSPSKMPVVR